MNFGCNYLVPHSGDPWISMKENQIMKPKHEIVINLVLHYEDPNFLEFKSIQYKVSIMENQNKNTHTHINPQHSMDLQKGEQNNGSFGCNYLVPRSGDLWISMKENQIITTLKVNTFIYSRVSVYICIHF